MGGWNVFDYLEEEKHNRKMRRTSRNSFNFDFSLRRLLLQGARAARGSPPLGQRLCDVEKGSGSGGGGSGSGGGGPSGSKHHDKHGGSSGGSNKVRKVPIISFLQMSLRGWHHLFVVGLNGSINYICGTNQSPAGRPLAEDEASSDNNC